MINRRTLLVGTAGLAASSLMTGCSRAVNPLQIKLLAGAIPPEVLNKFSEAVQVPVRFETLGQMTDAFQQLQRWQQTPQKPEEAAERLRFLPWRSAEDKTVATQRLVSIGDYWLESAIAQNLIEPLNLPEEALAPLPIQWEQFVTRNDDGRLPEVGMASSLWAAPYKVQSLVIVYRQSQARQLREALGLPETAVPFRQWRDLLSPVLQKRIAIPGHPNLVIGLLQKIETGRFNTGFDSSISSRSSVARLLARLRQQFAEPFAALNRQVRTYDSATALKALINEDVQVVVAWSGDVQLALQRYQDLRVATPEEGSLLSADMWVRPKGDSSEDELNKAAKKWISFCWQPGPATQISVSGRGLSPIFLSESVLEGTSEQVSFPEALERRRRMAEIMQKSEPLLPLPETLQAAYFALWEELRADGAAGV